MCTVCQQESQFKSAETAAREREALLANHKMNLEEAIKADRATRDKMQADAQKLQEQLTQAQAGMEAKRTILKTVKTELSAAKESNKELEAARTDLAHQLKVAPRCTRAPV